MIDLRQRADRRDKLVGRDPVGLQIVKAEDIDTCRRDQKRKEVERRTGHPAASMSDL